MNGKISQEVKAQAGEAARRAKTEGLAVGQRAKVPAAEVIRPVPAPVPAVPQQPKGALDERTLREAVEFTIVFADDKGFKCKLLAADNYNLIVESNDRRMLIPKHSIKYVALPASLSPRD